MTAPSFCGHAIAIRLRAVGGGNAGGIEQVLRAPWNAVQRTTIFARGNLLVGLPRLLEGVVARERDDAAQLGIEAFEAMQIDLPSAAQR